MRILVITDGLEPSLHFAVAGLADRGHRVRVIGALSTDEIDPVERFRLGDALRTGARDDGDAVRHAWRVIEGVGRSAAIDARALRTVTTTTLERHGWGRDFTRQMAQYLPVLAERADVVYFEAANVAAEYADVLDHLAPKVVMCTGSDVRVLPDVSPWLQQVLPAVFARMARVLCRSEDIRGWAVRRGAPLDRSTVIYGDVDRTFFSPDLRPPRPADALRLVSIGRLHWVKGYEYALQAVSLVRRAGHDVTYTIMGADEGNRQAIEYAIRDSSR